MLLEKNGELMATDHLAIDERVYADLRSHFAAGFLVDVGKHDTRAFPGEQQRVLFADAARRARHDGDATRLIRNVRLRPCSLRHLYNLVDGDSGWRENSSSTEQPAWAADIRPTHPFI